MPTFKNFHHDDRTIRLEVITQPIYSHLCIGEDGPFQEADIGRYSFFQQSCNDEGVSQVDTNLWVGGSLAWPKRFNVEGIRIIFGPDTHADDIREFYNKGSFILRIGEKDYLNLPLVTIASEAIDAHYLFKGDERKEVRVPLEGKDNIYYLENHLCLPSSQNFRAVIQAHGLRLTKPVDVWVFLEGTLYREIC